MIKKRNKALISISLGEEYYLTSTGIMKIQEDGDDIPIGKIFIHQMTIKRDVKDRYEPLYSIEYDDLIFEDTKLIENKTFDDLVNFIDKQKLIYEKKDVIENIFRYNVIYNHGPDNYTPFIVKEKVDFEKEGLPMNKI